MAKNNRNAEFGRLLKAAVSSIANIEGSSSAIVEEDLGADLGLSPMSIQRYKAGHVPPEERTIEVISEAAVRRGFLSKAWLKRFLNSARYSNPEKVISQLFPGEQENSTSAVVYQNLPSPGYTRFIGRAEEISEMMEGLRRRSPAVLLVGMGGVGKTSLAFEVASQVLRDNTKQPKFDAVVWITDKNTPGTTSLNVVLDEIAYTLDKSDITKLDFDEKRRAVEQLLRKNKVLVVLDNAETIAEKKLLTWISSLPEPSKAIVTTRIRQPDLLKDSWLVELDTFREEEARSLLREKLQQFRIGHLVNNQSQLDLLVRATANNPLAIEIVLGLIKYNRKQLSEILEDLSAARGDVFDAILAEAWNLLEPAARSILFAMAKLPDGIENVDLLKASALEAPTFDRAIHQIINMSLLQAYQKDIDSPLQYIMNPLLRLFVKAKRRKSPESVKP